MYDETDKGAYCPSEDEIRAACQRIRQTNQKAMKAGKGNHCRRHPTNIRTTSAGSHRTERSAT
jgi:hypothetical protein